MPTDTMTFALRVNKTDARRYHAASPVQQLQIREHLRYQFTQTVNRYTRGKQ